MRIFLIVLLLRILAWMPLAWTHALASVAARMAFYWPGLRARKTAEANLTLCYPELSVAQHRALLRRALAENAKNFAELGHFWLRSRTHVQALIARVAGEEHLHHALAQKKGVLIMTPHFGAWELAGYHAADYAPMTSLYRPPKLAQLSNLMRSGRENSGAMLVPVTPAGVKALLQRLRAHEMAGILPDQDPGRGNGVFAPFLGVPAHTMLLVHRLLHKTNALAVFTYAQRLPNGQGFALHFFPAPPGIYSQDPVESAAAMNAGIAHCIACDPAQYLWTYKRFKTRPPGMADIYAPSR